MQNKKVNKIFIIILFFIFVILLNNKCLAKTYTDEEINAFCREYNFATMSSEYKETFKKYSYHAICRETVSGNILSTIFLSNDGFYFIKIGNYWYLSQSSDRYIGMKTIRYSVSTSGQYPMYLENDGTYQTIFSYYSNIQSFCNKLIYSEKDYIYVDNNTGTQTVLYEGIVPDPEIVYETPTLYIDDMNFRKRFSFQFNIPMVRDDTKYYVFLEDYNRISYSSVSATFRIYTVTTPEDYDYTDYENYMYYDDLEKKLYLPAGCEIKEYSCTGNNGDTLSLTLENEFTASRNLLDNNFSTDIWFAIKNEESISWASLVTAQYLVPTNSSFNHFSLSYFIYNNLATGAIDNISKFLKVSNIEDAFSFSKMFYKLCMHTLYYSSQNSYVFDNFSFSNSPIVSYENKKDVSEVHGTFYNLFRKTKIYNMENMLNTNMFSFQYTDSEDVSSLLPEGTSVEYLTSPFYQDNNNSSSGGYITYDVQEILQGDKIIDYSQEDNSIHNTFNSDYIENYSEGDNIVINNFYTETIDKTSDSHLLHNIYLAILEIKLNLFSIGDNISNTTNNFTYNAGDTISYYFKPNVYWHNYYHNQLKQTFQNRLSLIYDPFVCVRYFFTGLSGIVVGNEDIVFEIPSISWQDVVIIPETNFNFTSFMENDLPVLRNDSRILSDVC